MSRAPESKAALRKRIAFLHDRCETLVADLTEVRDALAAERLLRAGAAHTARMAARQSRYLAERRTALALQRQEALQDAARLRQAARTLLAAMEAEGLDADEWTEMEALREAVDVHRPRAQRPEAVSPGGGA